MKTPGFQMTTQCNECPWRKDVPAGQFLLERFEALKQTCTQGFFPLFACHKTPDTDPQACVGYLANPDSTENFFVRLAISQKRFDRTALRTVGAQYDSYMDMYEFQASAAASGRALRCRYEASPPAPRRAHSAKKRQRSG